MEEGYPKREGMAGNESPKITSPAFLRRKLQEKGLSPRRSLGQNFLVDENILHKIISAATPTPGDFILDIGAGPGALSLALAESGCHVIALEKDKGLASFLREEAEERGFDRLQVVEGDVRRLELRETCADLWGEEPFMRKIKVVGNLPYYLTTPLLFQLLQGDLQLQLLVLMVQLEVARRIKAAPGSKEYGALSLLCRYYSRPRLLFKVPPSVFYPPPEVASAVVSLEVLDRPPSEVGNEDLFWAIVKKAFQKRRKTLPNALEGLHNLHKEQWAELIKKAGLSPSCRGETLSLEQFAYLAQISYNNRVI